MEKLELEKVWAKSSPFQSVEGHAIVAGTVAQVLLAEYLSAGSLQLLCNCLALEQNKAVRFVGYLASLHDIGKIEPHFQAKDEEMRKKLEKLGLLAKLSFSQQTRHEKTTRIILSRIWEDELELFADILASHHQGKSGDGKRDSKEPWRSLREELEQRMRVRFWGDEELPGVVDFTHRSELSAVLLGVIILADWIASGTQFADAEDWVRNENADVYIREKTAQFLTVSGLAHQVVHWGDSFCGVWPNIPSDGLRSLQQKTQELFSKTRDRISVVLMEAPMGEGKTEAGLYAALQMARQWGKDGFYVALPTAATSNQMVGRMRHLLKLHHCEDHVKLLHGMAWLTVTEDPQFGGSEDLAEIRRWLQPRKRGLLAPYAVGTVDQVMMAVCNVKYGVLRLLGLSQKVLVIDEIHSYDVYMSRFIHLLLKWCKVLEIPVVLLSATLPPQKKRELLAPYTTRELSSAYPAITAITEAGEPIVVKIPDTAQHKVVSIELSAHLHEAEEIAKMADDLTENGGCICILLNTVDQAQAVYQSLKSRKTDAKLLLFHARFPAKRRAEIEKECVRLFGKDKTNRPQRAILVATQVVEQSLDVDFDAMISATAPIDLILQRMGRVHRHSDTVRPASFRDPKVYLLTPAKARDWGVDEVIYPSCLLNQSHYLLNQRTEIRIPEDMQALVADGYDMSKAPLEELEKWLDNMLDDQIAAASGRIYQINDPDGRMYSGVMDSSNPFSDEEDDSFLNAKTRLSEPTIQLALLDDALYGEYCKSGKGDSLPISLTKRLMEQAVTVQKKKIYGKQSDIMDINYDKHLNVRVVHLQDGCAALAEDKILIYDPEIGVQIVKDGDYGKTAL